MFNVTERLFIFSTFQKKFTKEHNAKTWRDESYQLWEQGFRPQTTNGVFNGEEENGFAFFGDNNLENLIKDRAFNIHNQECYLVVYWDKHAELVFPDGHRKALGKWEEVDKDYITKYKCDYTSINNKYYVVK